MSVLGLYWVCQSQWKLLCALFLLTICMQSLVIFRVVECLHVCGSGSHSSYLTSGLFLLDSQSSGLFQQGSLSVHTSLGYFCTLMLYSWYLSKLVGVAQITLFILLGVLPDDSVHQITWSILQIGCLNCQKVIDPPCISFLLVTSCMLF